MQPVRGRLLDLWHTSCPQQEERGQSTLLNPKLCRQVPVCWGTLISSGKSRSHWYLVIGAAAPVDIKYLYADPLRVWDSTAHFLCDLE